MSALTSIFNFLYVFIRAMFTFIIGGWFDVRNFSVVEQQNIARQIIIEATNGQFENGTVFPGEPILLLVIGVFAIGSIIALVRRLIKG